MSEVAKDLKPIVDRTLERKFEEAGRKKIGIEDFVSEFLHQFLSPQTRRAYQHDMESFFSFLKQGNVIIRSPSEIKSHHFQIYRDTLMEKGHSSATINRKLVAIRSFIKWSMALKLIDHNPLDVVKLPKVKTESPTLAFDDNEVLKMINAPDASTAQGVLHRLVLVFLFNLGLRRAELTQIKLQDIYQDRGHTVLKIRGKGDKERHLPINEVVESELKNYLYKMSCEGRPIAASDFIFQSTKSKGKCIDGSTVYRIVERYALMCEIFKDVSPHSCRATVISHLLDTHELPIRDVATFAGHSNITTTERYDKRRENLDKSAAYKVNYRSSDDEPSS